MNYRNMFVGTFLLIAGLSLAGCRDSWQNAPTAPAATAPTTDTAPATTAPSTAPTTAPTTDTAPAK